MNEPIADTVRGILDGHIVLDRALANKGQFPAVNILKSISRVMSNISDTSHIEAANKFRDLLSTYQNSEDLINIGAYKEDHQEKLMKRFSFIRTYSIFKTRNGRTRSIGRQHCGIDESDRKRGITSWHTNSDFKSAGIKRK